VPRSFFVQVAEAVIGFLPRELRAFSSRATGRTLKLWYDSWHEHYEVQVISRQALRAARLPSSQPMLEVRFHAEHPQPQRNEELLARLRAGERDWRRRLGRSAQIGPFVGRREQAERWRRISELWDGPNLLSEESAIEAAERLAAYVRALEPARTRGSA
jgi:hypothetical protein